MVEVAAGGHLNGNYTVAAAASTAAEAFRLWVPFDGTEKKRETSDFLFIKSKVLFLFSLVKHLSNLCHCSLGVFNRVLAL